ncbi:MAG: DUF2059 domain-containing protein [Devosia sp.]|jgi:hypothetical protein|nr:DUF2059 domain-containing protein [Devosiaceae bacterium]
MIRLNRRGSWLAAALLSLTLFSATPGFAQEISPDQLSLARKYVDLTDKVDIFGTSLADIAARTLQQVLKLNPTLGGQATQAVTEVVAEYKKQRDDLMDKIARVYAEHFTTDELKELVTFYSTPVGQKLASSNFDINQQLAKVMQLYQLNLSTEFYAKVRANLKAKGLSL